MAALPVELFATGALLEQIEISLCPRQQPVPDRVLDDRTQLSVAVGTAPERAKTDGLAITPHHLKNLVIKKTGADQHPLLDRSMLENTAITGQDNTPLGQRGPNQRPVVAIVPVRAIQAEQSQPPGQATEMDIENKSSGVGWWRTEGNHSVLVGQNPERNNFDNIAILQAAVEGDTLPVDQDHINFCVGNTAGLDCVLD